MDISAGGLVPLSKEERRSLISKALERAPGRWRLARMTIGLTSYEKHSIGAAQE